MQSRVDEIKGWLNAYRKGWISYDSGHVRELRLELRELLSLRTNLTQ